MNDKENVRDNAKELISVGADLAGSAAGGALGFIAAGPIGAATGALAGTALAKAIQLVNDIAQRHLSEREKKRIGAGLAYALDKIAQHLADGHTLRNDGFFDADMTGRAPSDEILEGILFRCKTEPEENKVRLFGNVYANIAFMQDISVDGGNWLLQKAQNLTYRQLCMLSIIQQKEPKGASWGPKDGDPAFEMEFNQIEDLIEHDNSSYAIKLERETGESRRIMGLSRVGMFLFQVMSLDEIPEDDLRRLATHFPRALGI